MSRFLGAPPGMPCAIPQLVRETPSVLREVGNRRVAEAESGKSQQQFVQGMSDRAEARPVDSSCDQPDLSRSAVGHDVIRGGRL